MSSREDISKSQNKTIVMDSAYIYMNRIQAQLKDKTNTSC